MISHMPVDIKVWNRFKSAVASMYGTTYGVVALEIEKALKDRAEKLEREQQHQGGTPVFGPGKTA